MPLPVAGSNNVGDKPLLEKDFHRAREWLRNQPALHAQIREGLGSYPTSCLYDDECQLHQELEAQQKLFQNFLRHLKANLGVSPRAVLLQKLTQQLDELYDKGGAMLELYKELGLTNSWDVTPKELGLKRGTSVAAVAKAVEAVGPGQVYAQWQTLEAAAQKPSQLDVSQRKIRDGLTRKASTKSLQEPSPQELECLLECRIAEIRDAEEKRRAELYELAALYAILLRQDVEHRRWIRVRTLWRDSGAEGLWEAFLQLDRAHGEDRRSNGSAFEGADARLAAAMAVELLTRAQTESCKSKFERFSYLCNAEWRDAHGKLQGEVDVVVFGHGQSREGSNSKEVISLIEMKSGWFELPAALFLQHSAKLAKAKAVEKNMFLCSGAHQLQLSPREVETFVATLIPPHRFVIGLDPFLLRLLCQHIYSNRGGGDLKDEEKGLNLDDLEACSRLLATLRADQALQARLAVSPAELMRNAQTSSRVLVLGSAASAATRDGDSQGCSNMAAQERNVIGTKRSLEARDVQRKEAAKSWLPQCMGNAALKCCMAT
ncbi:unnamed protein product [Polarella glacialis]|uniref:Uncharacterized protein n=1 Tax=Polarella glacialis TaxID=89957 RepID=A0A813HDT2_POLGL|nr:unnamed protein product [Polarella glacialis]